MKLVAQLVGCAMLLFSLLALAEDDTEFTTQINVASKWLLLVDEGDHVRSWHQFSPTVQARFSELQWQKSIASLRSSLGEFISRRLVSAEKHDTLPDMPQGEYIVVQYQSEFSNNAEAKEAVTLQKMDNIWLILGYVAQ